MNVFPAQSDHPLFRYFTDEERKHIERLGRVRHLAEGDFLIKAGDNDSTVYTVEDGHLHILGIRDGKSSIVATVGPGDVLGEVSFVDDSPRTASVKADEATIVRAWDHKTLAEALAFEPQLLAKFSVALCELLVERLRDNARRV
jgi:CRP-like cAMP-binding protein